MTYVKLRIALFFNMLYMFFLEGSLRTFAVFAETNSSKDTIDRVRLENVSLFGSRVGEKS